MLALTTGLISIHPSTHTVHPIHPIPTTPPHKTVPSLKTSHKTNPPTTPKTAITSPPSTPRPTTAAFAVVAAGPAALEVPETLTAPELVDATAVAADVGPEATTVAAEVGFADAALQKESLDC